MTCPPTLPATLREVRTPAIARFPVLAGIDFTSRPSRRKPIVVALGGRDGDTVALDRIERHADFDGLARWLSTGQWLGVFDLPFGLPRELVATLGWPLAWEPLMRHYAGLSRAEIRATFAAFCDARPSGAKFAHRVADRPAGSSPSMKWVNPPVAYMLHAGVPLLMAAGVQLPGLHAGDPSRVALEGYPGLLAREILGRRSYKADARAKQTPERTAARAALVDALAGGQTRLGLRLSVTPAQRDTLIADASGDRLDAVLCAGGLGQRPTRFRHPARGRCAGGLDRHRAGPVKRRGWEPGLGGQQPFRLAAPASVEAPAFCANTASTASRSLRRCTLARLLACAACASRVVRVARPLQASR